MASYPTPSSSSDTSPQNDGDAVVATGVETDILDGETTGEAKDGIAGPEGNLEEKNESENGWASDAPEDESGGSGSNSESADESQPSYQKLLEWWRRTSSSAKDLRKISKSLVKIKKTRSLDWKREMKEVISNVNGVLQLRDELIEELEEDVRSVSDDGDMETRICVPKLHFVPWRYMMQWRHSSRVYAAIDIPSDKPPDHFYQPPPLGLNPNAPPLPPQYTPPVLPVGYAAPPAPVAVDSEDNTTAKPYILESYPTPEGVPNRIRINSLRLQMVLVEERRATGEVISPNESPDSYSRLIIYKPFKILHYFQDKIRHRLQRCEDTRRDRSPDKSEAQFQELYDEFPVSDIRHFGPIPPEHFVGLNEMTAFINDLRCLVQFIDTYLVPERDRILNVENPLRLPDLWHLFPVGSLVYCKDEKIPQKIWRVAHAFFGRKGARVDSNTVSRILASKAPRTPAFYLDCYYLEYDGARYVPISHRFQIHHVLEAPAFSSPNSMVVVPLHLEWHEGNTNKDEVLLRGKRFIQYATKARHLYYTGRSSSVTPVGEKLPHVKLPDDTNRHRTIQYSVKVDSPVMVDYARTFQEVPWWRPDGSTLNRMTLSKNIVVQGWNPGPDVDPANQIVVENDHIWDLRKFDDHIERESKKWRDWEEEGGGPTEDDDLMLLPSRIFAFVFRTRKWACLELGNNNDGPERLTEIVSRAEPWTDLELPEGHKEVVQSLITWHFKPNKAIDPHFDLVRDKGKGVIILLHGVPGVGKTSTAECAAESNGRPLFPITCGDLGLTPQDVEAKLEEIFRLAQAWGCILLLDEADVFLAQRTASDIHRNSLVSVFLRILEHYEGILFLTTNRVGVFDEAFKSRIHISLYYPSLDHNQTYQIWQSHITKGLEAGIQVNRDELINFAAKIYASQKDPKSGPVWNGRQIRNAFQSALALAGFHAGVGQSVRLETQHFQKVFNVSDKFSNYIWRVRQGHSDSDWNRMNMVRRDDFDYVPPTGLDVMNNMVPPGPYGMYPGGQARFGGAGAGTFQRSTFGQGIPSAVFGIPQPQPQPSMQPQMAGMFGSMANPFQQFAQTQYQQATPIATSQAQAPPGVNLQGQQAQPQAAQTQQPTQPAQYNNPFQAAQFGQTVAQHAVQSQQQQQQQQPQQQNPFLQHDGNYTFFAPQAQPAFNPSVGMQPQPGVTNNLPVAAGVSAQTQQPSFGPNVQQPGVGTGGFIVPDANAAQQQQQTQQTQQAQ